MYLELLESIVSSWNGYCLINNPDSKFTVKVMKDHLDYSDENPYFISIVQNDIILCRKGLEVYDSSFKNPYDYVAKDIIQELCFGGISHMHKLFKDGTLVPTEYKPMFNGT